MNYLKRVIMVCGIFLIAFFIQSNGIQAAEKFDTANVYTSHDKKYQGYVSYDKKEFCIRNYKGKFPKSSIEFKIPSNIDGMKVTEIKSIPVKDKDGYISRTYFFETENNIKKIIIPNSVTIIGENAFRYCNDVEEISIPKSVESLGDSCFYYCESLKKISLSSKITDIPDNAFVYCRSLSNIKLGKNIQTIGKEAFKETAVSEFISPVNLKEIKDRAFEDCNEMEKIHFNKKLESIGSFAFESNSRCKNVLLPASLKSLGYSVFSNCLDLQRIKISESNPYYTVKDKTVIYSKDKSVIIEVINLSKPYGIPSSVKEIGSHAFYGTRISDITIPGTVKKIGNYAFASSYVYKLSIKEGVETIGEGAFCNNRAYLDSVTIPSSVAEVGKRAFEDSNVRDVTFSEGLQIIGERAFSGCDMTNINIPKSLITIKDGAFSYCNSLKELDLRNVENVGKDAFHGAKLTSVKLNHVKVIGDSAFEENRLSEVTFSDDLLSIGKYAFYDNYINEVTIPKSVKDIGKGVFYDNGIKKFNVSDENQWFKVIKNGIYSKDGTQLIAYRLKKGINRIPNGVSSINDYTFVNSYDEKDKVLLVIPSSVKTIGKNNFYDESFTVKFLGSNPPSYGKDGKIIYFKGKIYVPKESLDLYRDKLIVEDKKTYVGY